MKNGITSTTFESLVIGPGVVYKNFQNPDSPGTIIGATVGGNDVKITRTYHTPEIDGLLGPLKGSERIVQEIPTLTAKFIDVTKENLMMALPGTNSSAYGSPQTHDMITSDGQISEGNYMNIAIIGDVNEKDEPIIFVVKNAISTDPFEINLGTGKEDVALGVVFTGHYDPASPTTAPYEIYNPTK
jgi:hypothetical protein